MPSGYVRILGAPRTPESPFGIDGFYAEAFVHSETDRLVIAFEGTNPFAGPDWRNANVPMARGESSVGFLRALEFVADALRLAHLGEQRTGELGLSVELAAERVGHGR